jgi:hypothetical protein
MYASVSRDHRALDADALASGFERGNRAVVKLDVAA